MGSHPVNLILRFLLELIALASAGLWGWKQSDNWLRFILAIGIPMLLAIIWGTFAVPNDPSRSGAAPIVTPGYLRLILEFGFFGFAIWTLKDMGWTKYAIILSVIILVHYIISYDRVIWLLSK